MSKVLKCLVIYNEMYTKTVKNVFFYIHFETKRKVLSSLAERIKTGSCNPPEPTPPPSLWLVTITETQCIASTSQVIRLISETYRCILS